MSKPIFNDTTRPTMKRPLFARDLQAAKDDVFESIVGEPDEVPAADFRGERHVLLSGGTPHAAIAGVTTDVDELSVASNWNLADAGASLFADAKDDTLYREKHDAGHLAIDVAEVVDVALGYYLGQNSHDEADDDSIRDVYLTHEPARMFIIEGNSVAASGFKMYGGRQARLKADPAADSSPWEVHPDATDAVALFDLAELAGIGGDTIAAGTAVLAKRRSFPKQGDRPAGVCWVFTLGGGSLPVGEHQEQVYKMVASNQAGWGLLCAHPLPPFTP